MALRSTTKRKSSLSISRSKVSCVVSIVVNCKISTMFPPRQTPCRSSHQHYLLSLISFKNSPSRASNALQIHVKYNSNVSIHVDVDPKWTIKQLKEKISSKIGVPASHIKLIFAGRELQNTVCLEDYEMSQQSVIHAVRAANSTMSVETNEENVNTRLKLNFNVPADDCQSSNCNENGKKKHNTFYVYCPNQCKSLQPGKLRVRCNVCKKSTLTVSQDPCGWDDVLLPRRVAGTCQVETCNGDFAEFYFKCASHPSAEEDTCVALHLVRTNTNNVTCLICTDVSDPVMVFTCEKAHVMCMECFQLYCLTRLNDRQFVQDMRLGYTLPCPVGCENSLIEETHHFHLIGDEQYNRYQRFGAEECLLQAGGVLCPVPGCGAGIIPDEDCRKIVCAQQGGQGCGFVFCRNCLQGYHLGECEGYGSNAEGSQVAFTVDMFQAENARWDPNASQSTVVVLTKPCPKCRTPTERDGGCMHMVCTRPQCGFHWCWVCQTEWTRDCMGSHWFG